MSEALGSPRMPVPILVISKPTPTKDSPVIRPDVHVDIQRPEIPAEAITVGGLLGLSAQDLQRNSFIEPIKIITAFLIEQAGSADRESLQQVLDDAEMNLPVMPGLQQRLTQLVKFSRLSRMKSQVENKLEGMVDASAGQEQTWESFGKETGNWGPFLKSVEKKDATNSNHNGDGQGDSSL